jgi:hypothetical protein
MDSKLIIYEVVYHTKKSPQDYKYEKMWHTSHTCITEIDINHSREIGDLMSYFPSSDFLLGIKSSGISSFCASSTE